MASDRPDSPTTVGSTVHGAILGTVEDGIHVFRGVPYARPPVDSLRFRPPQPPEPWTGTRDALDFGPVAAQLPSPLEALFGAAPPAHSEDCLTLNVWTPGLDDARRPVMVWIHGGAFVNGSGSTPWYDGHRFARQGDVVLVTVNYRLGAFGFLHVDGGGEEWAGSGNLGILDQVRALEWVRDNIGAFGGDPGRVTIFGESAGAMSVGTLLATPAADGLYHRAILQSGAASTVLTSEAAWETTSLVLDSAGVASARDLAELPTEAILAAQEKVLARPMGDIGLPFQPVLDGHVLPDNPLRAVRDGKRGNVPTLVGTTLDEMTLFLVLDLRIGDLDGAAIAKMMESAFGSRAEESVGVYSGNRPEATPRDVYTAIATDRVFRIPAIRLAEAQHGQGVASYMYLFAWPTPVFGGALKACHALEIPFVFDNLHQAGAETFTGDGPERQGIADTMHRAWTSFAHDGDPGWPSYDLDARPTMRFDAQSELVHDPMGDERALW
ncbi:MAG: carboxylesterase/lipase family protein [Acidimicrobiia bacterium]|nr:carboxylesterase/lipase family protein [Acidimicrobiia bacterium]